MLQFWLYLSNIVFNDIRVITNAVASYPSLIGITIHTKPDPFLEDTRVNGASLFGF
jgi:hypothetical protein